MRERQAGFTAIEMVVVLAIIAIILAFMLPVIAEPIEHAKIRGAVSQAKEIVAACNVARVSPASTSRNATTLVVSSTYGPGYSAWTAVSVLKGLLSSDYVIPDENPFGNPYYFKMTDKSCTVAVELNRTVDGWEGYDLETAGTKSRIIVATPARSTAGPAWVQHQKRLLTGESIR
ncbi:type II secretion system protein [Pseudomonas aeruginosa]|uniref:type II secretion system protein n=1 Tax=Pseudomonas aeruginosa TaxID=287 RepID=UPI000EB602D0|nr:type II secretion system protein [Pseudomonas aeruginosa]